LFNWLLDVGDSECVQALATILARSLNEFGDVAQRRRCLAAVVTVRARTQLLNDRHEIIVKRIRRETPSSLTASNKITEVHNKRAVATADASALDRLRRELRGLMLMSIAATARVAYADVDPSHTFDRTNPQRQRNRTDALQPTKLTLAAYECVLELASVCARAVSMEHSELLASTAADSAETQLRDALLDHALLAVRRCVLVAQQWMLHTRPLFAFALQEFDSLLEVRDLVPTCVVC
jgi:hypothetical protein